MLWFTAPRYTFDGGADPLLAVECPGMLDVDGITIVPVHLTTAFRVPAYDAVSNQCLVGSLAPLSPAPSGWVPLTVPQAVAQFTVWMGRPAAADEVF